GGRVAERKLYESFAESDPDKLEKLVFNLEDAIVLRYHDLAADGQNRSNQPNNPNGPNTTSELQAITRAARRLLQLKAEKLGSAHRSSLQAATRPVSMVASLPTPALVSMPSSIQEVKQDSASVRIAPRVSRINWRDMRFTWRNLVNRTQAATLAVQRAWQSWV